MQRGGCVYILTNKLKTVLYTGVSSDLVARIQEHQSFLYPDSFTARYRVTCLGYYESFSSIEEAIAREKFIKGKRRSWKLDLINSFNPDWNDLSSEIMKW